MNKGIVIKAIKSDLGILISIIVFVATVIYPFYSIKTDIAVINTKLDTFASNISSLNEKDNSQDSSINKNSSDIANIRGTLSQRGINVRQADTTDPLN